MGRAYKQGYTIAGKPYTANTEGIANKMLNLAAQLIPGYPKERKFTDAVFNMVFRAVTWEIEQIEKETRPNRDDFGILTPMNH